MSTVEQTLRLHADRIAEEAACMPIGAERAARFAYACGLLDALAIFHGPPPKPRHLRLVR